MKKTIFLILCLLCSVGAMVQKESITGTVTDATGEAVIGASVVEAGTTNGVVTNPDGKFTLMVNPNGKIKVSCAGYQPQVIDIKSRSSFSIRLREDSEMLDEVIVAEYPGTQFRSKVTNLISKVKEGALTTGPFSNPAQALFGTVSGLKAIQSSGNPGAALTTILRGGTNLDGTGSPLVIVDGQLRNGLDDTNPENIESMDVLKDAGATALYGARASNGVVLVTTKKSKQGFREINFKAKVSLNYAYTSYDFLSSREYIEALGQIVYDADGLFVDKADNAKGYGVYANGILDSA